MSPGKHKQFDAAQQGKEGDLNIERIDLKSKAGRLGQLQNEEEGLEDADGVKQYTFQKGITLQSSSTQDLKNELKNNLSPSFGAQNVQQRSETSNSNNLAEFQEGNNSSAGSGEHQNIHYNPAISQQHGLKSQDEGQENPQFNQRSTTTEFDKSQVQNSAEKAYKRSQNQNEGIDFSGHSSDQVDQDRRLENKNSRNKAIGDSPDLEKRQASFGNTSHHEAQVRTIDLKDLMPSHGLEDLRSREDNMHLASQNPTNQPNPFSSHQEGISKYGTQNRPENQYEENQGHPWQPQDSSASKGADLARFKQDVSEFLVTQKANPSGKNESVLNREPFQKSFENNLSVEQERKTEFSADKNIHFGSSETEGERYSSSGNKNTKSSLKKGASKNPTLTSEENEVEFSKESRESNQNLRPSFQSKKNVQSNSSDIEANNQKRNQKETSSEAVERKSNQKQQNMGKGLVSDAPQLKTPNKLNTGKAPKSNNKETSNFQSHNKNQKGKLQINCLLYCYS